MDYQYTIEELSSKCQVSKQSIYNLISKNKEFVKNNSIKINRKIKYNQAVLDLFLSHYGRQTDSAAIEPPPQAAAIDALDALSAAFAATEDKSIGQAAQEEIEALEREIAALKNKLAEKEAECQELIKQNGATLMLLAQEKQEKLSLLPPPKKTIGNRIKELFHKEK